VHVHVEDVVPLLERHLGGGPVITDARIVDQYVYRPETLRHPLEHPVYLRGVGDVEVNGYGAAARGMYLLCHGLGALAGPGCQGDAGAGLGERLREGLAEARVPAGDDGGLARKVESVQNGHRTSSALYPDGPR
jgi:hypothetical protein